LEKRVNVRVEHIKHSKCREEFVQRVKDNAFNKKEAKAKGISINVKRQPVGPTGAHYVSIKNNLPTVINPVAYEALV
jgi:large subunit ribosomal protein L21e